MGILQVKISCCPQRIRRNLNTPGRRMSSTWTTTTSATGMPTMDPDVTVTRAPIVTFTEHNNPNIVNHGVKAAPKSGLAADAAHSNTKNDPQEIKHRPVCFSNSFPSQPSPNLSRKLSPEVAPSASPLIPRRSPEWGTVSPASSSPNLLRKSPDRMFTSNVFRRLSKEETQLVKDAIGKAEDDDGETKDNKENSSECKCNCHRNHVNSSVKVTEAAVDSSSDSEMELSCLEDRVLPKSKELDKLLDQIADWNFPIFDVAKHGNILTQVQSLLYFC